MKFINGLNGARLSSVRSIKHRLDYSNIDIKELGVEYFMLQSNDCDCIGSPEEQKEWHIHHISKCLKTYLQIEKFESDFKSFIREKVINFLKRKREALEKIKQKAQEINNNFGMDCYFSEYEIMNCTNSELLKEEESKQLAYLENIANT